MITAQKAADLLKNNSNDITEVEVDERGFVKAQMPNRLGAPYVLVVHPIAERLVLKIRVPEVAKVHRESEAIRLLGKINYDILYGCVGIDLDGEVMIEINHPCQDGDVEDPPPEVFARLVEAVQDTVRVASKMILHAQMVEGGASESVARQVITQLFDDGSEADDETL